MHRTTTSCTYCDHPVGLHGKIGCIYPVGSGYCKCAMFEEGELSDCQATYDGLQCDQKVHTNLVEHGAPAPNGIGRVRWTNAVAHWPVPDKTAADAENESARDDQVGGEHYRKFKIQPWDVVDEYDLGFYAGNALKYLLRAGHKNDALEDLRKCRHYIDKLIEKTEADDV